mgnify:CR=1 FL=1
MGKVIVVGGGAAGMLAGLIAARQGHKVRILEKNEKLGKKLFITGKGRCNITNAADMEILFDNVVSNKKFLYSSFYNFTNYDMINLLESLGVKTKVERGDRVFPASDKSSDVIRGLQSELERLGVKIEFHTEVKELVVEEGVCKGVTVKGMRGVLAATSVIVCTGGFSYQMTGSTGDGYRFAEENGHKVIPVHPSLVPLEIKESFAKEMQGLSLKNVQVSIYNGKKNIYENFGEMLFTHFGVSGPLILSASSYITKWVSEGRELKLVLDVKPALSNEQLDARLLRDFEKNINRQFKNVLDELLPKKMIPVIIKLSGIDPEKKANAITKEERANLVSVMKGLTMHIAGLRGFNEAIITKGGVNVKEINPATMESKLVQGLFFAGEVLDLDALTGGFNLQIAWSTAYTAGISVY